MRYQQACVPSSSSKGSLSLLCLALAAPGGPRWPLAYGSINPVSASVFMWSAHCISSVFTWLSFSKIPSHTELGGRRQDLLSVDRLHR
jgi:hypothetical protein